MTEELVLEVVRPLLPERPADGHKGTFGHALIIGGSRGFTGAPCLAAEGALRSGVGLVTTAVPRPLADIAAATIAEMMTFPLPATETEAIAVSALEPALEAARSRDAVALGPGMGRHGETQQFVLAFLERCQAPVLVDADGLNNLASNLDALRKAPGPRIVTPHPGEMSRLTGTAVDAIQADRENTALSFAKESGCVAVLKGAGTIIAEPGGRSYRNTTGNPGLATGGSGDVLSGIIAGLLAQGMAPLDAALLGVYVHGLAGDLAAEALTQRALIAGDIFAYLPDAWHILEGTDR